MSKTRKGEGMTGDERQQGGAETAGDTSGEGSTERAEEIGKPEYEVFDYGVERVPDGGSEGRNSSNYCIIQPSNETARRISTAMFYMSGEVGSEAEARGSVYTTFHDSQEKEALRLAEAEVQKVIEKLSDPKFIERTLELHEKYKKLKGELKKIGEEVDQWHASFHAKKKV